MSAYEYKVIPAPNRAVKVKGLRGTEARFASAVQTVMNDKALDGWEYLRTDTLPCEERQGLRGRVTVYQNLLVFRRGTQSEPEELLVTDPVVETVAFAHEPVVAEADDTDQPDAETAAVVPRLGPAIEKMKQSVETE